MATQVTWADIAEYVTDELKHEKSRPNRAHYLRLGNEAIQAISELGFVYETAWDNDNGDLTLSSATATLPIECIEVTAVEWDGDDHPLPFKTVAWLDDNESGWRTATGEPSYYTIEGHQLVLDSIPSGTTTGKLVVRGKGSLTDFVDGGTNPLAYLPANIQLAPAHYILANLPVDNEDQTSVARQQKHERKWDRYEARMKAVIDGRKHEPFRY